MIMKEDYRVYKNKTVYVCNHCWYETRVRSRIKEHLEEDHNVFIKGRENNFVKDIIRKKADDYND